VYSCYLNRCVPRCESTCSGIWSTFSAIWIDVFHQWIQITADFPILKNGQHFSFHIRLPQSCTKFFISHSSSTVLRQIRPCVVCSQYYARIASLLWWLCYVVPFPAGAKMFCPLQSVQTSCGAHPASCTMGTGSFPGVKSGRGLTLTPHPLLVPWSWKSRAIPLLPLWAVRSVQSISACTRVQFSKAFRPPMGPTQHPDNEYQWTFYLR
jgi:hypothetical protein